MNKRLQKDLVVVAFGTSLTKRGGWQDCLGAELQIRLNRVINVKTIAKSGATSFWASENVPRVINEEADIVLIEFYANDSILHRGVNFEVSRINMAYTLKMLRELLPNAHVFNLVMNPIGFPKLLIRPFVGRYISMHCQLAREMGASVVDTRSAWTSLSRAERRIAIPDGLHPHLRAYQELLVPCISDAIVTSITDK